MVLNGNACLFRKEISETHWIEETKISCTFNFTEAKSLFKKKAIEVLITLLI